MKQQIKRIGKLQQLTNIKTFWDDVRKMTKNTPKTKAYIIKSFYNKTTDAIRLQIIAASSLAAYKDASKIVRLLNKEKEDTSQKYHIVYTESKHEALNKVQEKI